MVRVDSERTGEMSGILARIAFIWFKHPNLRLCQLIANCFPVGDSYARSDKKLLERLKEVYPLSIDMEKDIDGTVKDMVEEK